MTDFNGTEGADRLVAGGANDVLRGYGGADTLEGGAGNDTLYGCGGGDVLTGGAGADIFAFRPGEGGGTERVTDFQLGIDRIQVTAASGFQPTVANTVQGGVSGTLLTWGPNGDTAFIAGVSGATLAELTGSAGSAVAGVSGQNLLGTSGNDFTVGGTGNDTVRSSAGDDRIEGGAGSDTYVLDLGRGSFVVTSPSEGVLTIHCAPSGLGATFGTDTISGVESFQIVGPYSTLTVPAGEMLARYNFGYSHYATSGNDKLLGRFGPDSINGGTGNDTIEGGSGNDRLAGGAGADVLRGNDGSDVFVFRPGEGSNDRVEDFEVGVDWIETHNAPGYATSAYAGTDAAGTAGTWVRWGGGTDAVFLPGVSGVALDALLV